MLYTENLNLKKPQPEDYAKIADLNENADKIDAAIASLMSKGVKFVMGTYTIETTNNSSSNPLILDVGFNPDLVIIYKSNNNNYRIAQNNSNSYVGAYSVPVILTNAYKTGEGYKIVENGFSVITAESSAVTQNYIAVKF